MLFTTAADLCLNLIAAEREEHLKQHFTGLERYHLMRIDGLGYIPFEREATGLLFQVNSRRYEGASVVVTANLAFKDLAKIFPDPMTASVVVDRLVYCGIVFEFSGESHRLGTRQGRMEITGGHLSRRQGRFNRAGGGQGNPAVANLSNHAMWAAISSVLCRVWRPVGGAYTRANAAGYQVALLNSWDLQVSGGPLWAIRATALARRRSRRFEGEAP